MNINIAQKELRDFRFLHEYKNAPNGYMMDSINFIPLLLALYLLIW